MTPATSETGISQGTGRRLGMVTQGAGPMGAGTTHGWAGLAGWLAGWPGSCMPSWLGEWWGGSGGTPPGGRNPALAG